ncbi:MAG: ABC transporter permease [Phycisphaerae bacterium]|nr:ABC transporter permease [Phycisphaerae bacterium]
MAAVDSAATPSNTRTISGIDAMRGVGAKSPQGFWADAWSRVLRRRGAVLAITWIGVIAFFAVFSPLVANGHPIWFKRLDTGEVSWPLFANLSATDLCLLLGALLGVPWMLLPLKLKRSTRLGMLVVAGVQSGLTIVLAYGLNEWFTSPERALETRQLARTAAWFPWAAAGGVAAVIALAASIVPTSSLRLRFAAILLVAATTTACLAERWTTPLVDVDRYAELEAAGKAEAIFTVVPWSAVQGRTALNLKPPMTELGAVDAAFKGTVPGERRFLLGTDNVGRDVLAQMLHACRLSISIGLVSTGIAVLLGVTIGSLMGYFGGKIDLVLFRVVEIFMAIPVLFLLIVAAGVLPRNTYIMMVIIGCVTWTGAARFTRAEFLKLRNQDFVQSARATGLPLRSILFRHMLPNGVTPVLVDASFAIAAAITFEATLSFLGLGPEGQASWGQLLSSATGATGLFNWWLAIFPGVAIFLTVLSYNVLGEALRDAIDPKLRKAAH